MTEETAIPGVDNALPERGRVRKLFDGLFAPWANELDHGDNLWEQDTNRAFLGQTPLRARALVYGIGITVVLMLVWSAFATVDEVTRGPGKVIPSRKVQVIQSQDGGVLTEILVREGDIVKQGQLLVRLDQTRSRSTLRQNLSEYRALAIKEARLRAMVEGTEFIPDESIAAEVPRIVLEETALFASAMAELDTEKKIATELQLQAREELAENRARQRQLDRSYELTREELKLTKPMVASGAVSKVEILRLEKEVNRLAGELAQTVSQGKRLESVVGQAKTEARNAELDWINEVRQELASTIARMNGLREESEGLSDRVRQTELRSPVNGTVKQLHFNTIGGVVLPGRDIVEIVPIDDTLLLEVAIHPRDIAFLVPGQRAWVKFTAYDFIVYGGLDGIVEHIGADTVMDAQGDPFYQVRVRTTESSLGEDMPIIPGMTVNVDILTGKKSILAYLMKPVLRAKQNAMTER